MSNVRIHTFFVLDVNINISTHLLEVKLPYDLVCPSVGRFIGWTVGLSLFQVQLPMLLSEYLFSFEN